MALVGDELKTLVFKPDAYHSFRPFFLTLEIKGKL